MTFLRALLASVALLAEEGKEAPKVEHPKHSRTAIIASGLSYHIKDKTYRNDKDGRKAFNNFNYGLGLEYRFNRHLHGHVGFYENSKYRTSFYTSIGAETSDRALVGVGAEAGLVTGYKDNPIPLVLPYVRMGSRNGIGTLQLMFLPPLFASANIRINLNKNQKGR